MVASYNIPFWNFLYLGNLGKILGNHLALLVAHLWKKERHSDISIITIIMVLIISKSNMSLTCRLHTNAGPFVTAFSSLPFPIQIYINTGVEHAWFMWIPVGFDGMPAINIFEISTSLKERFIKTWKKIDLISNYFFHGNVLSLWLKLN